MTTLIVLHGFRQNAAHLSEHLAPLCARLPHALSVVVLDGPHTCSEASLTRLAPFLGRDNPQPHLCWWDATDDGREYRGFEQSLAYVRAQVEAAPGPVGVLGFSQGAGFAASLAALAAHGSFPALQFVVLAAGRKPRALALLPLFEAPLTIPSLHVVGTRDPSLAYADRLAECFAPGQRELARWDGPHVLPTRGPGADAIVSFVTRQVSGAQAPSVA